MALADVFGSEDRVLVKFSEFYDLMKGCAERELLTNAVKARVPYEYIEGMLTGEMPKKEENHENH